MGSERSADTIRVEVVYGTPRRQALLALDVEPGCTALQAIDRSGIREDFPEIPQRPEAIGIFGRKVGYDEVLENGDRVEIYRPLIADPKQVRRERARLKKEHGESDLPE
jgi:putative ubiquitin-RnfH superfamily antitoxin RatB of RatAB toxin-antitoxin module